MLPNKKPKMTRKEFSFKVSQRFFFYSAEPGHLIFLEERKVSYPFTFDNGQHQHDLNLERKSRISFPSEDPLTFPEECPMDLGSASLDSCVPKPESGDEVHNMPLPGKSQVSLCLEDPLILPKELKEAYIDLRKDHEILLTDYNILKTEMRTIQTKPSGSDILYLDNRRLRTLLYGYDAQTELVQSLNNRIDELEAELSKVRGPPPPSPPRLPRPAIVELSGEELLNKIVKSRDEGRKAQHVHLEQDNVANNVEPGDMDFTVPKPTTPPPAPRPLTPRSTGWGIGSIFSRVSSIFTPSARTLSLAVPASAPPQQVVLPPEEVEKIGTALATTETPSRARRPNRAKTAKSTKSGKSKANTKTQKRNKAPMTKGKSNTDRHAIIDYAVQGVAPEAKNLAFAWAKERVNKIPTDSSANLGEKRKQLERPMKLKEVKEIPARYPWQSTGSFGLLPEFFDVSDSDEDEAPGWYMVDQLVNEQPPLKKRKMGTNSTPPTPSTIDSHGNSTSLTDLHPRPSKVPSPMFNDSVTHTDGGNIFEAQKPVLDRDAFMKELRRTGHVAGSGSFCVPEGDSDEESEEGSEDQQSNVWTQQPPPPPTPAHAQLPVSVTAMPTVPAIKSVDPVESQRARALKHTPAKQSRLREYMIPSPSLVSEAGRSPLVVEIGLAPDAMELELEPELLQAAQDLAGSNGYKTLNANAYGGALVEMSYGESEEDITEDDEL